jgi:hypothetical protein
MNLKTVSEEREQMLCMMAQLDSSRHRLQVLIQDGTEEDDDDDNMDFDFATTKMDVGSRSRNSDVSSPEDKYNLMNSFTRTPSIEC